MSLVGVEDRGAARHIVLKRPGKRNALNGELTAALGGALEAAATDERARVVVVRGEGAVFSSGMDLNELDACTQELADELLAGAPRAVGLAKRVMDAAAKPAMSETLEQEVNAQELLAATEDFAEGTAAFFEKRPPQFGAVPAQRTARAELALGLRPTAPAGARGRR